MCNIQFSVLHLHTCFRQLLPVTLIASLMIINNPVYALQVPWNAVPYSHFSDNEALSEVISALMTSQDVPVVVSQKIKSEVNLDFRYMQPKEFFNHLMSAYHLTWYYDGQMLYVYSMGEIHTGTVRLKHISVSDFSAELEKLGILDSRFSWRKAKNDQLVYFSGPERFISMVLEMSAVLDIKVHKPRKRVIAQKPTVYRWKDKDGIIRFSTKRPGQKKTRIDSKRVSKTQKMSRRTTYEKSPSIDPVKTSVLN